MLYALPQQADDPEMENADFVVNLETDDKIISTAFLELSQAQTFFQKVIHKLRYSGFTNWAWNGDHQVDVINAESEDSITVSLLVADLNYRPDLEADSDQIVKQILS